MADEKDETAKTEPAADAAGICAYKPGASEEQTSTTPVNSIVLTEADGSENEIRTLAKPVDREMSENQGGPVLPQRDYPRDPRALAYSYGQSQPMQPNTFLPRFLKALAWFILLGGSLASLSAALYQRYILPKLLIKAQQLLIFRKSALALQEKSTSAVRQLAIGNAIIYPAAARKYGVMRCSEEGITHAAIDKLATKSDTDAEKMSESANSDRTAVHENVQGASGEEQPINDITLNLRSSVDRLAESLTSRLALIKVRDRPQAAKAAFQSLEKLSSRLTNEAIYATTPSFSGATYGYSYSGAANRLPARGGADIDKLQAVRSEIRSLKGTFLTRRNFATPQRMEVEPITS